MIAEINVWSNGMVMVFDEQGNQVTELQGHISDVFREMEQHVTPDTKIYIGDWNSGRVATNISQLRHFVSGFRK